MLAQTLVRRGLAGHGQANAVLLPHTIAALARRYPERVGEDAAATAARLLAVARAHVAASDAEIDACVEEAAARPQLAATPPVAEREELRAIYAAALSAP